VLGEVCQSKKEISGKEGLERPTKSGPFHDNGINDAEFREGLTQEVVDGLSRSGTKQRNFPWLWKNSGISTMA